MLSQIVAFSNNCLNLLKANKVNGLRAFFKEKLGCENRSNYFDINAMQDLFLKIINVI